MIKHGCSPETGGIRVIYCSMTYPKRRNDYPLNWRLVYFGPGVLALNKAKIQKTILCYGLTVIEWPIAMKRGSYCVHDSIGRHVAVIMDTIKDDDRVL